MKVSEFLTKISYVFKSDIYVIDHKYILGGPSSETKNIGKMCCVLTEETSNLLKTEVSDKDFFVIINVKEAKKNLQENLNENIWESTKDIAKDTLKDFKKVIKKITEWKEFTFDEKSHDDFFNKNITVKACDKETETPISISKNMFPMLTEKNLEKLGYKLDTSGEYTDNLITKFDTDFFTIYEILYFLNF